MQCFEEVLLLWEVLMPLQAKEWGEERNKESAGSKRWCQSIMGSRGLTHSDMSGRSVIWLATTRSCSLMFGSECIPLFRLHTKIKASMQALTKQILRQFSSLNTSYYTLTAKSLITLNLPNQALNSFIYKQWWDIHTFAPVEESVVLRGGEK